MKVNVCHSVTSVRLLLLDYRMAAISTVQVMSSELFGPRNIPTKF